MMDPLLGINTYTTPLVTYSNGVASPTFGLLASELSLATPDMFSSTATIADISGLGQLLSAATTFQDQLKALQPGTATSGGGQNFGTDFPSLAAEAQSLVDAYNGLQNNIAGINGSSSLLGGSVAGASGLSQSLATQAQATYANGNSALTALSQLGITFQPSLLPGGGGSLSLNLGTLQSAFNSDAKGAFSLLSNAANALGGVAGSFVTQEAGQFSSMAVLLQASAGTTSLSDFLTSSLLTQAQSGTSVSSLFASGTLSGSTNLGQVFLALNEYNMVSGLFA
jgi:hypothetical protein